MTDPSQWAPLVLAKAPNTSDTLNRTAFIIESGVAKRNHGCHKAIGFPWSSSTLGTWCERCDVANPHPCPPPLLPILIPCPTCRTVLQLLHPTPPQCPRTRRNQRQTKPVHTLPPALWPPTTSGGVVALSAPSAGKGPADAERRRKLRIPGRKGIPKMIRRLAGTSLPGCLRGNL